MNDKDIKITYNEPIGSVKDIAKAISTSVQISFDQLLVKLGRQEVRVNLSMETEIERVIGEYVQKSCEITAKNAAITFAKHVIDTGIKDKLDEAYQELFYGPPPTNEK